MHSFLEKYYDKGLVFMLNHYQETKIWIIVDKQHAEWPWRGVRGKQPEEKCFTWGENNEVMVDFCLVFFSPFLGHPRSNGKVMCRKSFVRFIFVTPQSSYGFVAAATQPLQGGCGSSGDDSQGFWPVWFALYDDRPKRKKEKNSSWQTAFAK